MAGKIITTFEESGKMNKVTDVLRNNIKEELNSHTGKIFTVEKTELTDRNCSPLKGKQSTLLPINPTTGTNFSVTEFNTIRNLLNLIRGNNENTSEMFSIIITKNKKGDRVILLGIQTFLPDQSMEFKPIAEFLDPDGNPNVYYDEIQGFDQSNHLLNGFTVQEMMEYSEESNEPEIEPETCAEGGYDGVECEPEWDGGSWICLTCNKEC